MTLTLTHTFDSMPDTIAVFPLRGVLLLPRAQMPLNIFEPRYLQMVDDAMRGNRLIGIIQPIGTTQSANGTGLYRTGCAGRITSYQETDDGRMLITLNGISRFHIINEISTDKLYRTMNIDWQDFKDDFVEPLNFELDRVRLLSILRNYFEQNGLSMEWETIEIVANERLMNALSMICPLEPSEKQALLEEKCVIKRAGLLMDLLLMNLNQNPLDETTQIH